MFTPNKLDLINILCVREKRKLDSGGAFSFHGQFFAVDGDILPRVYIEVIAHRIFGIFALYKDKRYDVHRIDKPIRSTKAEPSSAQRTPCIPPDSHYHKRGKETFIQYSSEYSDANILAILDEIFTKSFK